MEEDAFYASNAAYHKGGFTSHLVNKGYNIDHELSGSDYTTFKKGDTAYLAFKGTDPQNLGDLDQDTAILSGTYKSHKKFKEAAEIAKKAKKKHGKVVTTGHSLGGTKAIYAADEAGINAIAFNPGTGIFGLDTGSHKVHIGDKDFISSRVRGSNVEKSKGGHSLSVFSNKKGWKV